MTDHGLARVPIFRTLNGARLDEIARRHPARSVPAGVVLARDGDRADDFVIVESGTVSATHDTWNGSRVRYAAITGPAVVDKAAVLAGGRHTATWTATTPCRVRRLPASLLRQLIDTVPALRDHVLRHLSEQVNRDRRAMLRRTGRPEFRVASWLLEAGQERVGRVPLPGSQEGLGEEIGLSRVSVNRALRGLASSGLLRVEPAAVVILDPPGLAAVRDGSPALPPA
ncbi:Crp/Fnr family transcriptional regulator [Micromonospora musae]|uniref:Crp/Fnr family transcriptional regulator n=1 Tax=Micromonospora musae TaxID=1894970 RepID=A0A3A9XPR2_9ACTN|nr:Crp/Fnr family transcriptional regulator [Micromonospora musae]RKN16557.1 Crp/Fnr family transcriptional regulator [Micromonospora musae]RKN27320.1 Crp/Fnr family transcriptional regulator [Micromonospora musae]